jgi:hypothetical protein
LGQSALVVYAHVPSSRRARRRRGVRGLATRASCASDIGWSPEAPETRIRHRSTRTTTALALLALVFANGCGDGDDQSAETSRSQDAAEADLAREADAICADAQKPLDYAAERVRDPLLRAVQQIAVSNEFADKRIAELERLTPPSARRARWNAYLDAERALLKANRSYHRSVSVDSARRSRAARAARARAAGAAASEAGVDSNVAARAAGLDTCAEVGIQARLITNRKEPAKVPGDGTFLPTVGVRVAIPDGWGPKFFRERNAQAFDNDDGSVYCALRLDHFGDPPGDGSKRALLDYAKEQSEFVKSRSQTYRLISIQPERAANGSGVSIRRVVDGRAGRIAFFYRPTKRYVVDCNTDEEHFEKTDREIFVRFMRGLTMPSRVARGSGRRKSRSSRKPEK